MIINETGYGGNNDRILFRGTVAASQDSVALLCKKNTAAIYTQLCVTKLNYVVLAVRDTSS
jgi:hypothetical protein